MTTQEKRTTAEERKKIENWCQGGPFVAQTVLSSPFLQLAGADVHRLVLLLLDERDELAKRDMVDAGWAHEEIKAGIAFRERAEKAEAEVATLKKERDELEQRIADIEAEVVRLMDAHVQAGRMLAADHVAELLGWLRATFGRKP